MSGNNKDLADCKICELVDMLCDGEPESVCDIMKNFLDENPTPNQIVEKSFELFGKEKSTRLFNKLADDMGT